MIDIGTLYQVRELDFEEELRQRVIFKRSWKKTVMWLELNREDFAYADLTESPWMPVDYLRDLAGREYYKILVGEVAGWVEWTDYLEQAPISTVE